MKITEIERTAAVCWSPVPQHPSFLASGTVAGTLDVNFNTNAHLELFSLDLSSQDEGPNSEKLKLVGKTSASDRFSKLCWSQAGTQNGNNPYGLIAGGLANGSINIWDPAKMMNSESEEECLIACCEKHTGPVQGLEFNPFQYSYLASGGQDAEILIWDFASPSNPTVYNPGTKSQQHQDSGITAVAWNRKVQHILASTNYSGVTSIWDLKAKRSVLQFSDQNKRLKCRAIAWNPEEPTQIITASEDDSTPVLELWDLRNTYSPTKYFEGHTKGIWSISWCPMDYDLLLSCGKDHKTLCWDIKSGSILCEVETNSNSWNFDVQWSPRIPTLLSTCSLEGKVKLFSLQDVQSAPSELPINEPKKPLLHAPKWLRCPVGASFGFGGKIAVFKKGKSNSVMIFQMETEPEFLERVDKFQQTLKEGDLKKFCQEKIASATDDKEKESWKLLEAMLGEKQRYEILKFLGFDVKQVQKEFEKISGEKGQESEEQEKDEKEQGEKEKEEEEDSASVFDKLAEKVAEKEKQVITFPEPDTVDGKITQALLQGDYEKAIDVCIENDRMADALILAKKSPELWEKTQETYLRQQSRPFIWMISAIVKDELKDLIERVDLEQWKSTLAILCLYARSEDFAILCNLLGDRLRTEANDEQSATICYIVAGDVEKTVGIWTLDMSKEKQPKVALQNFIEKVSVFREAVKCKGEVSETLLHKYSEYANLLASEGRNQNALEFLSFLTEKPEELKENALVLLDRLYYAQSGESTVRIPPLPKVSVGGKFYSQKPSGPMPSQPSRMPSSRIPPPSRMPLGHPPSGMPPSGPPPSGMPPSGPPPSRMPPSGPPPSRMPPSGPPPSRMPVGPPPSGMPPSGPPPSRMPPSGPPPSRMPPSGPPPSRMPPSGPPPSRMPVGPPPSRMPPSGPPPSGPPPSGPPPTAKPPSGPPPTGQPPSGVPPSGPPPSRMPPSGPPPTAKPPSGPPPSGPPPTAKPPSEPSTAKESEKEEPPKKVESTSSENQVIIDTINGILSSGTKSSVPKVQKSAKDANNRLSEFMKELSQNKISNEVREDVLQFVQAINSGDTTRAREIHTSLTQSHWEELGSKTVAGLKRLIDITK